MTHEELYTDVEKHRRMVFKLAYGCTGNVHDAEDMTQEAFLRLYKNEKPFAGEEHKKAFLIRVTVNLCRNLHKSAWTQKRAVIDIADIYEYGLGLRRPEERDDSELREYIMKLKPAYRAVIHLHYYEGYTTAEVARLLKITESAVTTRLSRARGMLKTQLTKAKEELAT